MFAYRTQPRRHRRAHLLAGCAVAAALASPAQAQSQAFLANPSPTTGTVSINQGEVITGGVRDTVRVTSPQAVIDWTPRDTGTGGGPIAILPQGNELVFTGATDTYTVLNRVIPTDPSRAIKFDGLVKSQFDSGYGAVGADSVWFYSPGGIILGATSRFDVGNLVLTTNDINTASGLFGDGSTLSQTGTIAFRGVTDSRSGITVMPGAQINASGSYLAIVAPRLNQGGTAVVEGSAALIAAESADLTIPVSGGLFTISVQSGSNVAAAGDTTLTHSGTTETRDAALTGAARRLYLMAVPKNEAVTMLVSGNLGYSAAQAAQLGPNGAVYLTTGPVVNGDTDNYTDQGNIRVTGGNFGGYTRASAQNVTIDTTTANLNFSNDLTAYSVGGSINVSATAARTLTAGNVLLGEYTYTGGIGGSITVSAAAGSTIQVNNLTLSANARGESGYGTPGGDGKGGTLSLIANGGIITAADFIQMDAGGFGSDDGFNSDGGNGVGGTVTASALNNGRISVTNGLGLTADGEGGEAGYGGGIAGTGTGGSATVQTASGGLIEAGSIYAHANGQGAYGDNFGNPASNGIGGTVTVSAIGNGHISATGVLGLGANGNGGSVGNGGGAAGNGIGGRTNLQIASGGLVEADSLSAEASGFGGNGGNYIDGPGGIGGNGTGGAVSATLTGGQLRSRASDFMAFGQATDDGLNGTGGTIAISSTAGSSITGTGGDFTANASGFSGDSYDLPIGNATGGTVTFLSDASTLTLGTGSLIAHADGTGGYSYHFAPATNKGGSVSVTLNAATPGNTPISVQNIQLTADGHPTTSGGIDIFALRTAVDHGTGSTGVGGSALLIVSGGSTEVVGSTSLSATGTGDNGDYGTQAGAGFGGRAELRMAGGNLNTPNVTLQADAFGGDGAFGESGYGAAGTGGTAGIGTNPFGADAGAYVTGTGGTITANSLSLSAAATGGFGGDGLVFSYETPLDAGAGGSARGGTVSVVTSGVSMTVGALTANANGTGGTGGAVDYSFSGGQSANGGAGANGTGGTVNVSITQGSHTFGVFASADGQGGRGGDATFSTGIGADADATSAGGNGGIGTGGAVSIAFTNATLASTDFLNFNASAEGNGGFGAYGARSGNGGAAQGGTMSVLFDGGTASLYRAGLQVGAQGASSSYADKLDAGRGGDARGGDLTLTVTNNAVVAVSDQNYDPFRLVASARGGQGGSGGGGAISGMGGNGGRGGDAIGGNTTLSVTNGGSLRVPGFGGSESYSPSMYSSAAGGLGGTGAGGTTPGASGGTGGDGGLATAGIVKVAVTGGKADFDAFYGEVRATSGPGGSGGAGPADPATGVLQFSASGSNGIATGGHFELRVNDSGANPGIFSAADLAIVVDGDTYSGGLEIADLGTNPAGGISLGSLYAVSDFGGANPNGSSDYLIRSTARRIAVTNGVQLYGPGNIAFAFQGTGGLDAGGDINVQSTASRVTISHAPQTTPLSASLSGQNIQLVAWSDIDAQRGSLLSAPGNVGVQSYNGRANIANAIAVNQISISSFADATVGSLSAGDATTTGSIFVRAGAVEGFVPSNVTVTGNMRSTGSISIRSSADTVFAAGAQAVADQIFTVDAGDDILVHAGALVRAANNAPPETGYGVTDPLNQQSMLILSAGENYIGNPIPGDLGSIVIDGTLEAPDRTVLLTAGAVAGSPGSQVNSGNLYVRLFNIPTSGQTPADDGGLLSGACLEGSVCLGAAAVTNIVRIGEDGYVPLNLQLGGGIDAVDVLLRANAITLGQSGTPYILRASDSLTIESLASGLTFNGPIAITGGSNVARVAAAGDLTGAEATISAPGTLDLYATNNVTLGGVAAQTIRTVDFDGNVVNGGGITMPDTIAIGNVRSGTSLLLNAGGNIALDTLAVTGTATLRALSGTITVATDADATAGIDATARAVSLAGLDGLKINQATATAGNIVLTSGGPVDFGTLTASNLLSVNAQGDVSGSKVAAATANIRAAGDIAVSTDIAAPGGITAIGRSVSLNALGGLRIIRASATNGDVTLTAQRNILADTIDATGKATLKAAGGPLVVTTDLVAGAGAVLSAPSIDITAQNGLNILQADATAGDLRLRTVAGDLAAGTSTATGGIVMDAGGNLDFASLTAQQDIVLNAGGSISGDALRSLAGGISAGANGGVSFSTVSAGGPISLDGGDGSVTVITDIASAGPVQASGDSISLRAIGDLRLDQGTARTDITLVSVDGGVTLDSVQAGNALTVSAPGVLTVNGRVIGRTISATSGDLAIGANGRLGDKEVTTGITLVSSADRMFLGSATGTGYRIDEGEFTRIFSRGDISLVSAPSSRVDEAYSLADPASANIVLGSLVFDGSQLGSTGTLFITSPQSIGITGNVQFRNFSNGQTVNLKATNDIALAAETGLVTIKNANGGLAGALVLDAQQVHALSAKARSDIAGLALDAARKRLATNDGARNDDGYFQANAITARVSRLLFIQNSGVNSSDKNDKRGFTTNNLTINAGEGVTDIVIHGRIGDAVGEAIIPAAHLNGSFDPQSGFNTCLLNVPCTVVVPPKPTYDFNPVLSAARDQVKDLQHKDRVDWAQGAMVGPIPIIQFADAPQSRFDPLVDEPVTGAGNEDYWEQILPVIPGQRP